MRIILIRLQVYLSRSFLSRRQIGALCKVEIMFRLIVFFRAIVLTFISASKIYLFTESTSTKIYTEIVL